MPISLVCCSLIGTVVDDAGTVDRAYTEAIATQGVVTGTTAFARCMAQVTRSAGDTRPTCCRTCFRTAWPAARRRISPWTVPTAARLSAVAAPIPGAAEAIEKLKAAGMQVS